MIEDYVYISTDFSPEQTTAFFWKSLTNQEMEQTVKKDEQPSLFTVEAFRRNPEACHSVVRALNMSPIIWMIFLLNKRRDPEQAQDIIFKSLLRMMQEMTGDIALLHGGDEVILIRKSDQLLLKNGYEFWVPERLKTIPMPYNMTEMPQ